MLKVQQIECGLVLRCKDEKGGFRKSDQKSRLIFMVWIYKFT